MTDLTGTFRDLHNSGCFILPNPWDTASARVLAGVGYRALASTSSGYAFATGRRDGTGEISLEETLDHAAALSRATGLPVTADAEDGGAPDPEGVARTVRQAAGLGLAGISIEDSDTSKPGTYRGFQEAAERIAAAVEGARASDIVLTARADGFGKGAYTLDEAIRRLQRFEELGAEVVYAPGLPDLASVRAVCEAVSVPVNHVLGQGGRGMSFEDLAEAGVRRISLGGSLTRAAFGQFRKLAEDLAAGELEPFDHAPGWGELT